jgi:hypothetical protein
MTREQLEVALAESVRDKWGDNGVEYLVGALSSVTTTNQLTVLLESLNK